VPASQLKKEVLHAMKLYKEKCDIYAAHRKQHPHAIEEWESRPRELTIQGKDVLSIYKNNCKKSKPFSVTVAIY
jgi:hypothetical protein